jgi:hypothetical protein
MSASRSTTLCEHEIRALIAHHADMLSDCVEVEDMDRDSIFGVLSRIMELAELLPHEEEARAVQ